MHLENKHFLLLADIEGSSGCWRRSAAQFLTPEWARACMAMTRDVNSTARALLEAGAAAVTVHDFHRTGYNLLPEYLDPRIELKQGYCPGRVPGVGDPRPARAALFIGMHGASGTPAFLAHTLTSRVARLTVNGRPLSELELFAAALGSAGIRPIFFSGCPEACRQALSAIPGMATHALDKTKGRINFRPRAWRIQLGQAASRAARHPGPAPYRPPGPFRARLLWGPGPEAARKLAGRWEMPCQGAELTIEADDLSDLYRQLLNVCYLTPALNRVLPAALALYRMVGRCGLQWVRYRLRSRR